MSNSCSEPENSEKMPATISTSTSASSDPASSKCAQESSGQDAVSNCTSKSANHVVNGSDQASTSEESLVSVSAAKAKATLSSPEVVNNNVDTAKSPSDAAADAHNQTLDSPNSSSDKAPLNHGHHEDCVVSNGYAAAAGGGHTSQLDDPLPPLSTPGAAPTSVSPTIMTTNAWANVPKFVGKPPAPASIANATSASNPPLNNNLGKCRLQYCG